MSDKDVGLQPGLPSYQGAVPQMSNYCDLTIVAIIKLVIRSVTDAN